MSGGSNNIQDGKSSARGSLCIRSSERCRHNVKTNIRSNGQCSALGQSWTENGQLLPFTVNDALECSPSSGVRRTSGQRRCGPKQEPAAESRGAATPRFGLAPNGLSV